MGFAGRGSGRFINVVSLFGVRLFVVSVNSFRWEEVCRVGILAEGGAVRKMLYVES